MFTSKSQVSDFVWNDWQVISGVFLVEKWTEKSFFFHLMQNMFSYLAVFGSFRLAKGEPVSFIQLAYNTKLP